MQSPGIGAVLHWRPLVHIFDTDPFLDKITSHHFEKGVWWDQSQHIKDKLWHPKDVV